MELIYSYTRKQAIEDGVLVDVTEAAKKAGFKIHTVITETLHRTLEVPESSRSQETYAGRLGDVLNMLTFKLVLSKIRNEDRTRFRVIVGRKTLLLYGVCGPDDDGNPCLTIGFPEDF